jgi:peptidoglycan/xylan/chitin deacetylase (PgdA/CDA1 family)
VTGRALRWLMSLGYRGARRGDDGDAPRLTIIRHHRVYADREGPLYRLGVSESVFAAQVALLVREGLLPITAAEGWRRLRAGNPGHHVAMTFDDGYADNVWRAMARLQDVGARATFYLTSGLIETRRAPWWDELAFALERTHESRLEVEIGGRRIDQPLHTRAERLLALHAVAAALRVPPVERDQRLAAVRLRLGVSETAPCELANWDTATALVRSGMEVGAHTLTHPFLSVLPAEDQSREIEGSIELIEERLGVTPTGLAYPGGDHDARTVEAARVAGLAYAVTTRAGDNGVEASPFELRRRGLSEGACLGPAGFSNRLALAELDGAFDGLRRTEAAS